MAFSSITNLKQSSPEVVTLSDSDEEIFVGPITEKEKRRAARLHRRTQVYFPPVSWKLRSSNQSLESRGLSPSQRDLKATERQISDINKFVSHLSSRSPSTKKSNELKSPLSQNSDKHQISQISGYTADVSTADKTDHIIAEADSSEFAISADSLNSLSRDSLDVERDSLEKTEKSTATSNISDQSSATEDLYDARDYLLNANRITLPNTAFASKPGPERRFTDQEMNALQKQLGTLAADIEREEESFPKLNNSCETEDCSNDQNTSQDAVPSSPFANTAQDAAPASSFANTAQDAAPASSFANTALDAAPASPFANSSETVPASPFANTSQDAIPASPFANTSQDAIPASPFARRVRCSNTSTSSGIPSPYDLNKQKLTASLLYDSCIDCSTESNGSPARAPLDQNRLDTVNEVTEPSSTDLESRLSSVHLSDRERPTETSSPAICRSAFPRGTPKQMRIRIQRNSTQMFEELEREVEEEERLSNLETTFTISTDVSASHRDNTDSPLQTTYTVSSKTSVDPSPVDAPESDVLYSESINSSREGRDSEDDLSEVSHTEDFPEGVFNDTLEEYEMLMKYGVDYINGKQGRDAPAADISSIDSSHHEEARGEEPANSDRRSNSSNSTRSSTKSDRFGCVSTSKLVQRKVEESMTPLKGSTKTPSKSATGSKTNAMPKTPKTPHAGCVAQAESANIRWLPARSHTPKHFQGPEKRSPLAHSTKANDAMASKKLVMPSEKNTPGNSKFKVPTKIPLSASRTPRGPGVVGAMPYSPRPSKLMNTVQSPIGAYIHNSPSPVLMRNIKPKTCPSTVPREHEKRLMRPVWDNVDTLRNQKGEGSENVNPNVVQGLRVVHYTQAPCINLDDHTLPKPRLPRLGERLEKLLDTPCPQITKHEGRVRVNPSSPQYSAAVKAVRSNLNDSVRSEAAAGDISVCVTKIAKRTNTLGTSKTTRLAPMGRPPSREMSATSSGFGDCSDISVDSDSAKSQPAASRTHKHLSSTTSDQNVYNKETLPAKLTLLSPINKPQEREMSVEVIRRLEAAERSIRELQSQVRTPFQQDNQLGRTPFVSHQQRLPRGVYRPEGSGASYRQLSATTPWSSLAAVTYVPERTLPEKDAKRIAVRLYNLLPKVQPGRNRSEIEATLVALSYWDNLAPSHRRYFTDRARNLLGSLTAELTK